MLTSINPWLLPFLVVVQLHVNYSSCIFKKICTSAAIEDPFIFKIICTDPDAAVTHSKLLVTLFTDVEEDSFQQIGRTLKEFIFFRHKYST